MKTLYRFIFRVDFDQCYAIADRPGSVMETVLAASDDFWDAVGPTNNPYQINSIKSSSKNGRRFVANFTVDTNAISGSIEVDTGIEFDSFFDEKYPVICSKALEAVLQKFDIRKFNRVGMRLFFAADEAGDFNKHREAVGARFKDQYVPSDLVGDIELSDVALILQGSLDHDVQFRLQCGPGAETDFQQFLPQIRDVDLERIRENPHAVTVDVDIFQQNINFKGTNLLKWLKAKDSHIEKLFSIARFSVRG